MGQQNQKVLVPWAAGLLIFGFIVAVHPTALACDEAPDTCFEQDPDNETGGGAVGCSVHLVNRHLEAWVECDIGFMSTNYVASEDAPELSPEVFLELTVVIQRMGPTGTDEPWGFRLQEGVPGVIIDGSAYQTGILPSAETSTTFTFKLSADLSANVGEAVIGVAFWDSEHNVKYDRLAFAIEDTGPVIPLAWVAWLGLILAILALILAVYSMRRRAP